MPMSRQVRMIRSAISPRLQLSTFLNTAPSIADCGLRIADCALPGGVDRRNRQSHELVAFRHQRRQAAFGHEATVDEELLPVEAFVGFLFDNPLLRDEVRCGLRATGRAIVPAHRGCGSATALCGSAWTSWITRNA